MKAKFTLLAALFLLATSIYALDPSHYKRDKLTSSFLQTKLERTEGFTKYNPFQRKMGLQKPGTSLKSAQAIKQRLDGYTSWILDEGSGQWHEDEKAEYVYDANWNLILERDYEWDEMTNQLIYDWKAEYTYDAQGNLTQEIYYQLDEITNQFIANDMYTYTYDANGNRTQYINYSLDDVSGQLMAWYKLDFTYDASKNLTKEIYYYFNQVTNQAELQNKSEYTYNSNGQQILSLYSNWSSQSNQWEEASSKTETTYNSNGYQIQRLISYWDGNEWYNSSKEEFNYDTKGNLILDANFSFTNNQWNPWYKEVYTFDDLGNNTQYINYGEWDSSTGEWKSIWKDEYTFDNNYTSNDLIWLFEDGGNSAHMMTDIKEYEWNNDTKQWIYNYQITLNYSEVNVTSASILNTELSKVYPNPCSESISFGFPDSNSQINFELFDLQGRKLLSKAIGSNEKVNMEGLRSGIYLYKLNVDGKVQSGKLVKE